MEPSTNPLSRRNVLASTAAVGSLFAAAAASAQGTGAVPQPSRTAGTSGTDPGPHNAERDRQHVRTRDGTSLYVKDWGSGRPVILIHGWPLNADMFDRTAMRLAGRLPRDQL